jgi:flagellar basal-body rod protein FlgB
VEHLEAGLRAAGLRQAAIANNIANLATPGFRRTVLPFERVLAEAVAAGRPLPQADLLAALEQSDDGPLNENGNNVELDLEVGDLVKNSLFYKTYMRLLARTYRQMDLAIQDR